MDSFYSDDELKKIGLKSYGRKVKISRYAKIYSPETISIGDNVRIDDFCILSGKIQIGSNIHIAAYVALYGAGGIVMEDFTGISARSTVYSAMDDFSGDFLIGPIHNSSVTNVQRQKVVIERFSQVGAHCVLFPGVRLEEGSVVGAMSLVNNNIPQWSIFVGQPAKFLKPRNNNLLNIIK